MRPNLNENVTLLKKKINHEINLCIFTFFCYQTCFIAVNNLHI